jgi:hypothetical protein
MYSHAVLLIEHAHRLRLDCDTAFLLQFHGIQHQLMHIPLRHRMRRFNQPVGQRRFAVVDVGDDAKISYAFDWNRHSFSLSPELPAPACTIIL